VREYPIQSYWPSCRLRFIVRFDEFAAHNLPPVPKKPPQVRGGKSKDPTLQVKQDGNAFVIGGDTADGTKGGPQKATSSSDGRTFVIDGIIPKRCTLHRNGIRTADTLSAELSFADLPFDPRVLRAVAVEAFLGSLNEQDFQRGVAGAAPGEHGPNDAEPLLVLPETFKDGQGRTRSNLRFQGWIDEWETSFADGTPMVKIECTDNTRLLIEQEAPPKLTMSPDKTIDRAIADYLSNFPQFRGLAVEYRPAGISIPTLKGVLAKTAYKPTLGPSPQGGSSKLTVWDYITDVCGAVGHTVRIVGITIVIQRARTLYGSKFAGRPDDPFEGRILPSGRQINNRLFVYGRNIDTLSFKRKITRFGPTNIEVRCYSGKRKKTLVVRFPLKGDRVVKAIPGDQTDQKWSVVRVTGVDDEATLRVVAQGYYESFGRSELEVNFSTKNLASFGGDSLDPDCFDAEAGDTVEIEVTREQDSYNTIASIEEQVSTRAADSLKAIGYDAKLANAYQSAVNNVGYPTTFKIRDLTFDWDDSDGVKIHGTAVNYVEVRSNAKLPDGEEPPEAGTTTAKPVKVTIEGEL
jgi:hypothetical protein